MDDYESNEEQHQFHHRRESQTHQNPVETSSNQDMTQIVTLPNDPPDYRSLAFFYQGQASVKAKSVPRENYGKVQPPIFTPDSELPSCSYETWKKQ